MSCCGGCGGQAEKPKQEESKQEKAAEQEADTQQTKD